MKRVIAGVSAIAGVLAVSQLAEAGYFYRRTMKRNNARVERTIKMAGTDGANICLLSKNGRKP